MSCQAGMPVFLELKQISFLHQAESLLQIPSLRLGITGRTIIMGPNGAGKSLLMRLCHGLLQPSTGTIRWLGQSHANTNEMRRRQAMVFQRPVMLRRTAEANVMYALAVRGIPRRECRRRAAEALEHMGLSTLAQRPARVLSGGEQQRLALARAWALRPDILFLDEPTSALDPAATKAVEDAVDVFHRQGTRIVMSTHDLGQARRLADEVVFLCKGKLLEQTPAHQFFQTPKSQEAAAFIRGELVW